VKHLVKLDMILLNYHLEFNDILEVERATEITNHLDNCSQCKNRFTVNEYGMVVDEKEILIDKILEESVTIAYAVFVSGKRDLASTYKLVEKQYPNFMYLLEKYKGYGGNITELFLSFGEEQDER